MALCTKAFCSPASHFVWQGGGGRKHTNGIQKNSSPPPPDWFIPWHGSFVKCDDSLKCVTWHIRVCHESLNVCNDLLISCALTHTHTHTTWLIRLRHISFIRDMRDMTQLCRLRWAHTHTTWRIHSWHSSFMRDVCDMFDVCDMCYMCDMTPCTFFAFVQHTQITAVYCTLPDDMLYIHTCCVHVMSVCEVCYVRMSFSIMCVCHVCFCAYLIYVMYVYIIFHTPRCEHIIYDEYDCIIYDICYHRLYI